MHTPFQQHLQHKWALGKGRVKLALSLKGRRKSAEAEPLARSRGLSVASPVWLVVWGLLLAFVGLALYPGEAGAAPRSGDPEFERERERLARRYEDFWRVIDERRQRQLERLEAGDRYRVIRAKREEEREEIRRRFVAARDKAPSREDIRAKQRLEWEKEVAEREKVREEQRRVFAQRQAQLRRIREEEKQIPPMLELRLELDIEDLRE